MVEKINELRYYNSKFIQVYINEKPYLRFITKDTSFHADLLSKILKEFNINFKTKKNGELGEIPLEKDEDLGYELVGAGRANNINKDKIFFGSSANYECGTNKKHLEDLFIGENVEIIDSGKKDSEGFGLFCVKFKD